MDKGDRNSLKGKGKGKRSRKEEPSLEEEPAMDLSDFLPEADTNNSANTADNISETAFPAHPDNPELGYKFTYHLAVCEECRRKHPNGYDAAMVAAKTEESRRRILAVETMRRSMHLSAVRQADKSCDEFRENQMKLMLQIVRNDVDVSRQKNYMQGKKEVLEKVSSLYHIKVATEVKRRLSNVFSNVCGEDGAAARNEAQQHIDKFEDYLAGLLKETTIKLHSI